MSKNNNLAIGKIRTSFGLKGFVKVISFSGENSHFYNLQEVILENGRIREKKKIENVSLHGNDLIIKFEGIKTPEEARKYINWEIWVPREKACALGEGEYYISDLYGSALISSAEKGSVIYGKVKSVIYDYGLTDLLEIESTETGEKEKKTFLIPFINKFIGKIDTENKTIELLEEWIIP